MTKHHNLFLCIVLCAVLGAVCLPSVAFSFVREQDAGPGSVEHEYEFVPIDTRVKEKEDDVAEPKDGFWHYCGRILLAPFAILATYPIDEETDIYQTYVKHVNKHTGREIKGDSFGIARKSPSTLLAEEEEHAESSTSTS